VARKSPADAAKAKAEKQKRTVIILGVVLTLALGYAVHTMMSLSKGPDASSRPQVAAPTTASTTPGAPVPAASAGSPPAAPTLGGTAAPSAGTGDATASSMSSQLVSAVQPPADAGQLQSFSLFESKDPFHSSGPSSTGGGTSGGSSGGGTTTKPPKTPPAPPTAPPTSAVISVNGVSESVTSGGNFPATNPLFQLVSVTASVARVSVVGGSYANGAPTLTLRVNKPVTLANTADGTRYTLILQPQGTVAGGPAPTASPSGATTTTPAG
jgi:hypothetical protein